MEGLAWALRKRDSRVKPARVSTRSSRSSYKQQIESVNALAYESVTAGSTSCVNKKTVAVVCREVRQKEVAVGESTRSIKSPAVIPTTRPASLDASGMQDT